MPANSAIAIRRGRRRANAGEIRVDQWIAQHALQHRAADGQTRSDDGGDAHARKPQIPDDAIRHAVGVRMG